MQFDINCYCYVCLLHHFRVKITMLIIDDNVVNIMLNSEYLFTIQHYIHYVVSRFILYVMILFIFIFVEDMALPW